MQSNFASTTHYSALIYGCVTDPHYYGYVAHSFRLPQNSRQIGVKFTADRVAVLAGRVAVLSVILLGLNTLIA